MGNRKVHLSSDQHLSFGYAWVDFRIHRSDTCYWNIFLSMYRTYDPSITTSDVHQGPRPRPKHLENVFHLGCGRRDERKADLPQSRCHKRRCDGVQSNQRTANNPRCNESNSLFSCALVTFALRDCSFQKDLFLRHRVIELITLPS